MARFRAPPAGTVNEDLYERIAELDERLRVQDQWRRELESEVARLEKFHKAVRNAYYAPPMEAAPITDHDHRQVSRGVCAALIALEGGKQDGNV